MNINLDIARGLAALSVFLFHIRGVLEASIPFMAQLAQYGRLGVPLFFVISGYVITSSAEGVIRRSSNSNSFLKRRFLRIYPPFWASIIIVIMIPYIMAAVSYLKAGQYISPTPNYQLLTISDWIQVASLIKVFMSNNGDLEGQFMAVNSVYWTLAIEFQFYLCVYAALIFRRYFRSILLSISIISLMLIIFPLHINSGLFINFWPMFAIGILLYYLNLNTITIERIIPSHNKLVSVLVVFASILCLVLLAHFELLKKSLLSIFPSVDIGFAVISALILWFATPLEKILAKLKSEGNVISRNLVKAATFLGVISYSLYLLHGKIYGLSAMFSRQIIPVSSVLYPLAIIGGTIALCAIFYNYIEKPFMSKRQKKLYNAMVSSAQRQSG